MRNSDMLEKMDQLLVELTNSPDALNKFMIEFEEFRANKEIGDEE
ncbi:hypothetical protein D347_00619 [Enterococcus faecalis LA3B-2]|nr:hypothetical protein D347_00619 [Enterococcus faecalis LA3B-2]